MMADSNRFSANGTITRFVYDGTERYMEDPTIKAKYPVKPADTLLYDETAEDNQVQETSTVKFSYKDPKIHRLRSECPKCAQPVRPHLMIGHVSVLHCVCGYTES